MVSFLAPQWAFQAQAIHTDSDPHLAPGVHLRMIPAARLGLPAAPFRIYRANLGNDARKGKTRSEITWIDSKGTELIAPFQVTPDNPVTGWFREDQSCCWVNVDAVPAKNAPVFEPVRPPLVINRRPSGLTGSFNRINTRINTRRNNQLSPNITRRINTPLTRRINQPTSTLNSSSRSISRNISRPTRTGRINFPINQPPGRIVDFLGRSHTIKVEALIETPRGPATLASRSKAPYSLSASRIRRVVVSGKGQVNGARWLPDENLLPNMRFWKTVGLPISSGARYVSNPNAENEAQDRIQRGAPKRFGLHDAPTASSPATAPTATTNNEVDRLKPLIAEIKPCLKELIDNLSENPQTLTQTRELRDEQSGKKGEFTINCLGLTLTASLDPGMARWLGLMAIDESPLSTNPGDVVAYAIRGL
ncbi:MAG: hypothetical protein AAGL17_16985, partial [Cyanobacteria bacterium J06576_12]